MGFASLAGMIPWRPTGQGMTTIGVLSVLLLLIFGGPVMFRRNGDGVRSIPSAQMFFLGAGFMLLEAQIISKMALLFGTTWLVNSIVISGLLLLILLANAIVALKADFPPAAAYGGLTRDFLLASDARRPNVQLPEPAR